MPTTYKTIIHNAIEDFNNVQLALNELNAQYSSARVSNPTATGAVLVPTAQYYNIIRNQLQILANGELTLTSSNVDSTTLTASVVKSLAYPASYASVKLTAGSASTPATTITPAVLSGSANANSVYTVSQASKTQSVTPNVTTGWVTAGTAGTITVSAPTSLTIPKATFVVSDNKVNVATAGYIGGTADETVGTIGTGSITLGKSNDISITNALEKVTTDGSNAGVNVESTLLNTGTNTEPSSGYYVAFKPTSSGGSITVSTAVGSGAFTAGYISAAPAAITVSSSHSNNKVYYYPVKMATIARDGTTANITATTAGYVLAGTTLATMADASGYSITGGTVNTEVSVGTTLSSGQYTVSAKISGVISASTPGYYDGSNKTLTASSNSQVGKISAATFGGSNAEGNKTISSKEYSVGAGYTKARTLTVRDATVTNAASITTNPVNADDGYAASSTSNGNTVNIFSTTAPESGDYYSIIATAAATVSQTGWIASKPTDGTSTVYLPKAKFTYTSDPDDGSKLLTVSTGGYVPAGYLTNVANVSGTLATSTVTPTVDSLSAPKISYSGTAHGFTASSSATAYYVECGGSKVSNTGSVKAKAAWTKGYLASASNSTSAATSIGITDVNTTKKVYIPVASFEYVSAASGETKFISCKTAGYVPAGVITPTSGTMDKATFTLTEVGKLHNGTSYSGDSVSILTTAPVIPGEAAKISFDVSSLNPGYVTSASDIYNSDSSKSIKDFYISTVDVVPSGEATTHISTGSIITNDNTKTNISISATQTDYFVTASCSTTQQGAITPTAVVSFKGTPASQTTAGIVKTGTYYNVVNNVNQQVSIPTENRAGSKVYITAATINTKGTPSTAGGSVVISKSKSDGLEYGTDSSAYWVNITQTNSPATFSGTIGITTNGYATTALEKSYGGELSTSVTNNAGKIYIKPGAATLSVSANSSTSTNSISKTNVTTSTSTTSSGISIKASATLKATASCSSFTSGYIGSKPSNANGDLTKDSSTEYITSLTLGSGKTLSSITNNGTITTVTGTGTLSTVKAGTQTISALGASGSGNAGTITVTSNQYGTVNVWGSSGAKTVQVANHLVTVDQVVCTDASGNFGNIVVPSGKSIGDSENPGVTNNGTTYLTNQSMVYYTAGNDSQLVDPDGWAITRDYDDDSLVFNWY